MAWKDSKRSVSACAWMVRKGDVTPSVPCKDPDRTVMPARRTKLMETRRVILLTMSDYMGLSSGFKDGRLIGIATYVWKTFLCILNPKDKSGCVGKLCFGIFICVINSPVL